MARDTGTTMKLATSASAFGHSILATQRHARVIGHFVLSAEILMYFQLERVRTYTDFRVWRNNYAILATNVNPVTAPLRGAATTGLNALPKL